MYSYCRQNSLIKFFNLGLSQLYIVAKKSNISAQHHFKFANFNPACDSSLEN